eukprot:315887-Pleurochrysis_carterae.AAC.2
MRPPRRCFWHTLPLSLAFPLYSFLPSFIHQLARFLLIPLPATHTSLCGMCRRTAQQFAFDGVFAPNASQQQVYALAADEQARAFCSLENLPAYLYMRMPGIHMGAAGCKTDGIESKWRRGTYARSVIDSAASRALKATKLAKGECTLADAQLTQEARKRAPYAESCACVQG